MDEWQGFGNSCSEFEDPLYAMLSSPGSEMEKLEWSREEKKLFEKALADFDPASPGFLENVGIRVPWRSLDEIKSHYQALVDDLKMIESGEFPIPDYKDKEDVKEDAASASAAVAVAVAVDKPKPRRKGVRWTLEEHQLFLMGLNRYGKGDWRSISKYLVMSKSPAQVASHAQKYYMSKTSSTQYSNQHLLPNPNISKPHPNPIMFSSPTYN